jgi:hypothetical protein
MIKKDCIECGKAFEVEDRDKWKTKCLDCFTKGRTVTITPKPTPLQEIKAQEKAELDETTLRIMFGNCLNASGNALAGSCPTPKNHYAYAKELFELWTGKEQYVEEELVKK